MESRRGIIVSLDISDKEHIGRVVDATVMYAAAYKVGLQSILAGGMDSLIGADTRPNFVRTYIADFQKLGSDIPNQAEWLTPALVEYFTHVIVFPQAGPETLESWLANLRKCGATTIVGAEMTHPKFLQRDGGWISNNFARDAFSIAADNGVTSFVLPGNRPQRVEFLRGYIEGELGVENPTYYSPGFVAQGGDLTDSGRLMEGANFMAIIGRGIYNADDPEEAIKRYHDAIHQV